MGWRLRLWRWLLIDDPPLHDKLELLNKHGCGVSFDNGMYSVTCGHLTFDGNDFADVVNRAYAHQVERDKESAKKR